MRDPVCGMDVQPESASASETHAGQTYYFCCKGCAAKFRADPEKYLAPKPVQVNAPASFRSGNPPRQSRLKIRFAVCR